jgi:hypothetical protein
MGVRLAEGDSRRRVQLGVLPEEEASPQRLPRARRRRSSGRARRIRFATWTLLAVVCMCVVGSIARPARTGPSKGRQPPVAVVIRAIPAGLPVIPVI